MWVDALKYNHEKSLKEWSCVLLCHLLMPLRDEQQACYWRKGLCVMRYMIRWAVYNNNWPPLWLSLFYNYKLTTTRKSPTSAYSESDLFLNFQIIKPAKGSLCLMNFNNTTTNNNNKNYYYYYYSRCPSSSICCCSLQFTVLICRPLAN